MLVILYDSNAREHNYRISDNKIDSESQRDGKGEYEIICFHFIQFYTNSLIVKPLLRYRIDSIFFNM